MLCVVLYVCVVVVWVYVRVVVCEFVLCLLTDWLLDCLATFFSVLVCMRVLLLFVCVCACCCVVLCVVIVNCCLLVCLVSFRVCVCM